MRGAHDRYTSRRCAFQPINDNWFTVIAAMKRLESFVVADLNEFTCSAILFTNSDGNCMSTYSFIYALNRVLENDIWDLRLSPHNRWTGGRYIFEQQETYRFNCHHSIEWWRSIVFLVSLWGGITWSACRKDLLPFDYVV